MDSVLGAIGDLLHRYGYGAIVAFFLLEGSGVPVPSETMLVTAAAFAAHGALSQRFVLLAATVGGILGGHSGYAIGRFGGLPLVRRFGRLFRLDADRLSRAREFFARRGAGSVFLCKCIAFMRIIVPMIAGVAQAIWPFQRCERRGRGGIGTLVREPRVLLWTRPREASPAHRARDNNHYRGHLRTRHRTQAQTPQGAHE